MMRRKEYGITTNEYVFIFSLITIVAIPAVMFMGNVVDDGLNSVSGSVSSGASELAGLMDVNHPDPGAGGSILPGLNTDNMGGALDDSYGSGTFYENGSIMLPSGSTTTSAAGTTQLVSDLLQKMLDSGMTFDGSVLSPEQQGQLQNLIDSLNTLSTQESDFLSGSSSWGNVNGDAADVVSIYNDFMAETGDAAAQAQVTELISLVTHAANQLGPPNSVQIVGSSDPNITDAEVPGFTAETAILIQTTTY